MSCCGQKRSALSQPKTQGQPNAPGQPRPVAPGRGYSPLKAAMLAFLARKAVTRTAATRTGAGPQISRRRSR